MQLLSVSQAAEELGITRQGMYKIIKSGILDPKKVITVSGKPVTRIYSSEIEKLKKRKQK